MSVSALIGFDSTLILSETLNTLHDQVRNIFVFLSSGSFFTRWKNSLRYEAVSYGYMYILIFFYLYVYFISFLSIFDFVTMTNGTKKLRPFI